MLPQSSTAHDAASQSRTSCSLCTHSAHEARPTGGRWAWEGQLLAHALELHQGLAGLLLFEAAKVPARTAASQ